MTFENLFYRARRLDAEVYLRAITETLWTAETREAHRGDCPEAAVAAAPVVEEPAAGARARLQRAVYSDRGH